MELKCKVRDLYELRALINGFSIRNEKTGEVTTIYPGFVNEGGISEGVKRLAYKMVRVFNTEIETIDKQRQEISAEKKEGIEDEKLKEIEKRDLELLEDEVTVEIEPIDFAKVESLSLNFNYAFLYEKVFKNY